MISRIEIQNRQSHRDTVLDLHPGFNVLVGRGDSGKSSVLRQVNWAVDNRPLGDSSVSHWAKDGDKIVSPSSITIHKPEGVLKRFRTPTANGYELNGETYSAVGTSVPPQVSTFFNFSDVNRQSQHHPHFLISLPGGQVSAYLNRVVRLEDIDAYLSASASCLKEARGCQKSLEADQKADQKALDGLGWIEEIQGRIADLKALEATSKDTEAKAARLRGLLADMRQAEARIQEARKLADLEPRVQELRKLAQAVTGIGSRVSTLSKLRDTWARVDKAAQDARRVASLEPRVQELRKLATRLQETGDRVTVLRSLVLQWTASGEAVRKLRVVADLEPKASRLRKIAGRLEGLEMKVAGIRRFSLTFQEQEAYIQGTRKRVDELEAQRPETCPYCGANKEQTCKHPN